MKHIFMVSRYALFGDAVESLLGERSDLEIVGRESDSEKAMERIRELRPDVVILDNDEPDSELSPVIAHVLGERLAGRVIGLNLQDNTICTYRGEQKTAHEAKDLIDAIDDRETEAHLADGKEHSRRSAETRKGHKGKFDFTESGPWTEKTKHPGSFSKTLGETRRSLRVHGGEMAEQDWLGKILKDTSLSRRSFLKWSAAVGGAAAVAGGTNSLLRVVEASAAAQEVASGNLYGADKIVPTICTNGDVCGLLHMGQAYVKDGKIVYYEGSPAAWNKGALCARGSTGLEIINHPDRVKYPMLRTNEKGTQGEFKRISWDEAYDRITDAMAEAIQKEGSQTMSVVTGHYGNFLVSALLSRFVGLFDCDSASGPDGCFSDLQVGPTVTLGDYYHCLEEDPLHSKLIVMWGENDVVAKPQEWADMYWKAKTEHGAKIVHIESRKSEAAQKADLYIPVRPGADAYVALAMANVIIEEDLMDKDFIANHTYGFEEFRDLVKKYTPEAVEKVAWAPADRVRTAARWYATMKPAMLCEGRGGNQTGGKNSNSGWLMSRAITCLMGLCGQAGMKGAAFSMEASGGTSNNLHFHWPYVATDYAPMPPKKLVTRTAPKAKGVWGTSECLYHQKPYGYRVYMTNHNPVASSGDQAQAEEAFKKIPMVIVHNRLIHWTASRFADIVLPVSTWAEQAVWRIDWEAMAVSQPAIEPMFESKSDHQIYKDISRKLAGKLNLDVAPQEVWPYETDEDFVNAILKNKLIKAEYEKRIAEGHTEFEQFRDLDYQKAIVHPEGIPGPFYANLPDFVPYKAKYYSDLAPKGTDPESVFFPTYNSDRPESTGKLLFKADWLADKGLPTMPIPEEPEDHYYKDINPIESNNFELSDAVKNGFEFVAVGKAHKHWQFLSFNQNYDGGPASAFLREAHETAAEPCVEMNPRDGERLGLKQGDYVVVESQYGKMEHIKLLLTEQVMPSTIVPPYHWGNVQGRIYPYSLSLGSLPVNVASSLNPRGVGEWGNSGKKSIGGQNNQSAALCKVYKA
jgi:anaerobic selenocysteine-containing dehydrogenase